MQEADPATIARNPAAARRFVEEVLGGGNSAAFADLVHPDVVVRFEASADNTAALNGVPATGRHFTFAELHLMRFDGAGRLVENWVGGLNPLMFEIWQAPATAPLLLGEYA